MPQDYFAAKTGDEERQRIAGLEAVYDAFTLRRLLAAGLGPGCRCLEIGAGGGSIARAMGEHSGVRAVAVDMDPRFLEHDHAAYEVRQLDVTGADALGSERFDLIHCRFLLMHLPDPAAVIETLAARLSPGGALVVEEPDMLGWRPADPNADGSALASHVLGTALRAVEAAGVWQNAIGPRVPALMQHAGLDASDCEGSCWIMETERPEVMALMLQSLELIASHGLAAGALHETEVRELHERIAARSLALVSPTLFSSIGLRR
ncbi:MAG: class I SAM-dependent methyltransferase [Myxococcales bacterium]|nr:class I SAM-dependent methyltransferase [Myxococcales bacterium]